MTRWLLNKRAWVLVLAAGALPLGTVADCGYVPGLGGTFYYNGDGHDGHHYYDGPYGDDGVMVVHDWGYDEVYYEEVYYEDECCGSWECDCWW